MIREKVFEWLEGHWDYVKEMSGDKSLDNYPRYIAGVIKTERDFEKYKKFFDPKTHEPSLRRAIKMGKNEIAAKLRLIEKDKKLVADKLHDII